MTALTKYEECLRNAIAPVDRRMDCWRWANLQNLYIDRQELLESMSARTCNHIIVDTRDDDAAGGHIYGAIHLPDSKFDERSILKILTQVQELHKKSTEPQTTALKHDPGAVTSFIIAEKSPTLVVFHCM